MKKGGGQITNYDLSGFVSQSSFKKSDIFEFPHSWLVNLIDVVILLVRGGPQAEAMLNLFSL